MRSLKITSKDRKVLEWMDEQFVLSGISDVCGKITHDKISGLSHLHLDLSSYRHIVQRGSDQLIEKLKIDTISSTPLSPNYAEGTVYILSGEADKKNDCSLMKLHNKEWIAVTEISID